MRVFHQWFAKNEVPRQCNPNTEQQAKDNLVQRMHPKEQSWVTNRQAEGNGNHTHEDAHPKFGHHWLFRNCFIHRCMVVVKPDTKCNSHSCQWMATWVSKLSAALFSNDVWCNPEGSSLPVREFGNIHHEEDCSNIHSVVDSSWSLSSCVNERNSNRQCACNY